MMLGDLIAKLEDQEAAMEALLATGDVVLIARVQAAARAAGIPVGDHVGELIGLFTAAAGPDDWIAVMGAAGRTREPGGACLRIMLGVALASQETAYGTVPASP